MLGQRTESKDASVRYVTTKAANRKHFFSIIDIFSTCGIISQTKGNVGYSSNSTYLVKSGRPLMFWVLLVNMYLKSLLECDT